MQVQFEAVCGPKFMSFWDDVGYPSWLSTHLPIVYIVFCSEDIGPRPLNLPFSCEVVEYRSAVFSPPNFCGVEVPKCFAVVCYRGLPPTVWVWQSLVEFCGLKCVCKARQ